MMKALMIGGTGVISTAISRLLVQENWDLTLLNRGNRAKDVPGAKQLILDINDEAAVKSAMENEHFDVVADFIAYTPDQVQRDIRLFQGKTDQYFFISTASAYQKPLAHPIIRESTPLINPYWDYSRKKIDCENVLMEAYRKEGFPVTIVRPSHTFSYRSFPVPIHGANGAWQIMKRMMEGKKVLVPGDGSSLWAVMSSADFAPAFVGLMGNVHAIGQAVQIASEELLTWNQILAIEAKALGGEYKPCYVPSALLAKCHQYNLEGTLLGDKTNTVIFDNTLLHRLVPAYHQQKSFSQAARESVEYFLSHPELQKEDPDFDRFCEKVIAVMEEAERRIAEL